MAENDSGNVMMMASSSIETTNAKKPAAGEKRIRKKPKQNAADIWASLEQTELSGMESGSVTSSHISIARSEMEKEVPMIESETNSGQSNLSDMLEKLIEVEKRGVNVLYSREDLMMDSEPFTNPTEEEEALAGRIRSSENIPHTTEQDTLDLMQSIARFKSGKQEVGSPPLGSPIASPRLAARLPISTRPIVDETKVRREDTIHASTLSQASKMTESQEMLAAFNELSQK